MRKILMLMMVLPLLFAGCSKDDGDEARNPMVGTKWVSENAASSLYGMIEGKRYWHVREFKSENTYDSYYEEVSTGIKGRSGYFTGDKYEYHDTYITFYDEDGKSYNWYFISATEFCNKKSRTEADAVIYTKR